MKTESDMRRRNMDSDDGNSILMNHIVKIHNDGFSFLFKGPKGKVAFEV